MMLTMQHVVDDDEHRTLTHSDNNLFSILSPIDSSSYSLPSSCVRVCKRAGYSLHVLTDASTVCLSTHIESSTSSLSCDAHRHSHNTDDDVDGGFNCDANEFHFNSYEGDDAHFESVDSHFYLQTVRKRFWSFFPLLLRLRSLYVYYVLYVARVNCLICSLNAHIWCEI